MPEKRGIRQNRDLHPAVQDQMQSSSPRYVAISKSQKETSSCIKVENTLSGHCSLQPQKAFRRKTGPHSSDDTSNATMRESSLAKHPMKSLDVSMSQVTSTDVRQSSGNLPVVQPVLPRIRAAMRPAYSTAGKGTIQVVSNFYHLECSSKYVYHYDVVILTPRKRAVRDTKPLGKNLCHRVVHQWLCQYRLAEYSPIYDGARNLFCCQPLPFEEETEFKISFMDDSLREIFLLSVKPVQKKSKNNAIDMTAVMKYARNQTTVMPDEVRTVLEAILSYRKPGYPQINIRNSFYYMNQIERRFDVGLGCEMWSGYSQNIRFTGDGTAMVINTAAAVFHKSGPVIERMRDILQKDVRRKTLTKEDIKKLSDKLKSVKICVTHQKQRRKYQIECFEETPASSLKFLMNGKEVSVQSFFSLKYSMRLRYPQLPCIKMSSSDENRHVFMPPEVCEVLPNQRVKGKLDKKIAANVIKMTALPPVKKFEQIQNDACSIPEISAVPMEQYKISMSLVPVETTARVLGQPDVQYRKNQCSPRDNGVWEMRNQEFTSCPQVQKSMLISFAESDYSVLNDFMDLLCKAGRNVGLTMSKPQIRVYNDRDLTENVIEEMSKLGVDLIFVVLSESDKCHSYEEVKFLADIKFGIASQCLNVDVVRKVVEKMDVRTAHNICLKINTKLGGVNHEIVGWPMALSREGVIIMGADVIHHLDEKFPSIAALVGCTDHSIFTYSPCCRAQSNPKSKQSQEIILDLKNMVKSVLKSYYRQNAHRKPQKILFYRDGVSEGQFRQVLDKEIPMIKEACRSLEDSYRPPITFVVVQKRHPVRIRPKYQKDGLGRGGNVPPGTIVDKDIVDPQLYDFYLCSHEGIQGTSKPTRYTVLFDENRVDVEGMENLTYYLCHTLARCNRSISIPAPVKYADLLCTRASNYVKVILNRRRKAQISEDGCIPSDILDVINSIEKLPRSMFFI